MTESAALGASAFSVTASVAIVKAAAAAEGWTWPSLPDKTIRGAADRVISGLPHLAVESVFGLRDSWLRLL